MHIDQIERDIFLTYPAHHPLRQWIDRVEDELRDSMYNALDEAKGEAYEEGKHDAENAEGLLDKLEHAEQRAELAETKLRKHFALADTVRWVSKGKLTKAEMIQRLQAAYQEFSRTVQFTSK